MFRFLALCMMLVLTSAFQLPAVASRRDMIKGLAINSGGYVSEKQPPTPAIRTLTERDRGKGKGRGDRDWR